MTMVTTIHHQADGTTSLNGKPVGLYKPPTAPLPIANGTLRVPSGRRSSLQIARRTVSLEDVPEDENARLWSEVVKQRRVSRRTGRTDTEDDDNYIVGNRVDETHQNYAMAYNMLTGIRFSVSRTQAKLDRELTTADFEHKHKFSIDVTGTELTPAAKYDFKFKDYAPWAFRYIRNMFKIDAGDYLMSLTSKYILTEMGSPGKSKSFFYFSRDYKYIIKTIHPGEQKFLRKHLKDYYQHVQDNPNTLISQYYGLHRVKLPYGRKVHFVVMNNLMPPHKDMHGVYDLKGSTIGREYPENQLKEKLANGSLHPTLKDLNWLRRDLHIELGPTNKQAFLRQLEKDVAFLQRLKVMDYSLLVAMHSYKRGNVDGLRDKSLQVFQPKAERNEEAGAQPGALARTPSKLEHARRVRELRESMKKERPVPMEAATDIMPEEADRTGFFYKDDGGIRATNSDDTPSSTVYYLGIIDCLTRYNWKKKVEHLWKGSQGNEPQISPLPPQRYGDRFKKFISNITKGSDVAAKERKSSAEGSRGRD